MTTSAVAAPAGPSRPLLVTVPPLPSQTDVVTHLLQVFALPEISLLMAGKLSKPVWLLAYEQLPSKQSLSLAYTLAPTSSEADRRHSWAWLVFVVVASYFACPILELNLEGCSFGLARLPELMKLLALNSSIVKLNIKGNGFASAPERMLECVDFLMANNFTLCSLEVDPELFATSALSTKVVNYLNVNRYLFDLVSGKLENPSFSMNFQGFTNHVSMPALGHALARVATVPNLKRLHIDSLLPPPSLDIASEKQYFRSLPPIEQQAFLAEHSLPRELFHLVSVQELVFSNMVRVDVDKATKLTIPSSYVMKVFSELSVFQNVSFLSLTSCYLTSMEPIAVLARMVRLQALDFSNNIITVLPVDVGRLTNLTSLSLQHNSIGEVPASISQLTRLESLNLYDNCISGYPPDLSQSLFFVKDFKGLNQKGQGLFHPSDPLLSALAREEMEAIIANKPFYSLWHWLKSNKLDRNKTEHIKGTLKNGYMLLKTKKAMKKEWKRRWFEVSTVGLRVLKFEGNKQVLALQLANLTQVTEEPKAKRPYVLSIGTTIGLGPLKVAAPSAEEMRDWKDKLAMALDLTQRELAKGGAGNKIK